MIELIIMLYATQTIMGVVNNNEVWPVVIYP